MWCICGHKSPAMMDQYPNYKTEDLIAMAICRRQRNDKSGARTKATYVLTIKAMPSSEYETQKKNMIGKKPSGKRTRAWGKQHKVITALRESRWYLEYSYFNSMLDINNITKKREYFEFRARYPVLASLIPSRPDRFYTEFSWLKRK